MDGNDEVCNSCEPSKQGAAEPEPIKPFRVTIAPPVKRPNLASGSGPADFFYVRPGESLEPFRALIKARQNPYGSPSKRGTDSKGLDNFNVSFFICIYQFKFECDITPFSLYNRLEDCYLGSSVSVSKARKRHPVNWISAGPN